jgi:CheY-like chemotaxis protein
MVRVAVVDDRADVRAGRASWLQSCATGPVAQLSFQAALALEDGWSDFALVVLDGRDDRRDATTLLSDLRGGSVISYDRFMGPRVAERIRAHRTRDQTRIVLVSAYVRTNALLARRCQEAGVDYVYSLEDLNDADSFVAKVLEPDDDHSAVNFLAPGRLAGEGFDGTPSINAAIHELEANPAAEQLLFDLLGKRFKTTAYSLRRLREGIGPKLALRPPPAAGGRRRHVPKSRLSEVLRRALGIQDGKGDQKPTRDG